MTEPTDEQPCPKCGRPWDEHEFGVPAPYCPIITGLKPSPTDEQRLTKALEALAAVMAKHDESARQCNFSMCGCDYCEAVRPFVRTVEGSEV